MGKGCYKQNALNMEARMKVIEDSEKGLSQRELANKYKCGKTQIQKILRNKDKIREKLRCGINKHSKRLQLYEEVNKLTLSWFEEAYSKGLIITGPILQIRAKEFARKLGNDGFTGSNGWLQSFCNRNNIVLRRASAERTNVNGILKDYCPKDIYCAHETSLWFRDFPEESGVNCVSERQSEDLLTILLCTNAMGEKETPIIISTSSKNTGVKKENVLWYNTKDGRITQDIFTTWLNQFNDKMKYEQRNITILLNESACHLVKIELSNIKLLFLSANSNLQPLNEGIIETFKLHYQKHLLTSLSRRNKQDLNVSELAISFDVTDAVDWIYQAWNSVDSETIPKYFDVCRMDTLINTKTAVREIKRIKEDLRHIGRQFRSEIDGKFDQKSATCDNNFLKCEQSAINEITIKEEPLDIKNININRKENDEIDERIPFSECFKSINQLITAAVKLDNKKLINLLDEIQSEFERETLSQNLKSIQYVLTD